MYFLFVEDFGKDKVSDDDTSRDELFDNEVSGGEISRDDLSTDEISGDELFDLTFASSFHNSLGSGKVRIQWFSTGLVTFLSTFGISALTF